MDTELLLKLDTFEKIKDFNNTVNKFSSNIDIIKGHYVIDAKSLLGIFTMDTRTTVTVKILSDNKKEIMKFNEEMQRFK